MTENQVKIYNKLRNKLVNRGIKRNNIPTAKQLEHLPNNKIFMLIEGLSVQIKNLDGFETSRRFRDVFYETYGYDSSIYEIVENEISNRLEWAGY